MGRPVYLWNNLTLSPAQMASALWQAGFRDQNVIAQMVSIGQRESSGRAGVHGSDAPQGRVSGDRGLFQINYVHDDKLKAAGIIRSAADLFDPVINARAAFYLSGGGDPKAMRQLWGGGAQGWVGSGGTLPRPNYEAVQQASSSGWATNWAPTGTDTGSGAWPSGTGGTGGATPPPGATMSQAYYDSLYRGYDAQTALQTALTQNQVDYQRRQSQFAQQLAGYQMAGLDLQREQLGLENRYQNDLALLNRGLTKKQQETNLKEWRLLATNIDALRDLADQGLADDKSYFDKSAKLQKDIYGAAKKWIAAQKGFNQRDYQLALDALNNVLTTEASRWAEVKRVRGAESGLAKQKQAYIAKGATEAYGQAVAEAEFVEQEQVRKATSDATARGAIHSRGFGQDVSAFGEQSDLSESGARVDRDDIMRMSQNQLAGELERIKQAYQQGRISWQDANRQTKTARQRANLTRDQNRGQLSNQARQAYFDYQGNILDAGKQWRNAYLGYRQNIQGLANQKGSGWLQYKQNEANLIAQQEQAQRTQAYNNALYGVNLAGLANQGASYGAQLAQQQAGYQYGIDQSLIGGAQAVGGINTQRQQTAYDQLGSMNPYAPGGGSFGTGGGSRPSSGYTNSGARRRSTNSPQAV